MGEIPVGHGTGEIPESSYYFDYFNNNFSENHPEKTFHYLCLSCHNHYIHDPPLKNKRADLSYSMETDPVSLIIRAKQGLQELLTSKEINVE